MLKKLMLCLIVLAFFNQNSFGQDLPVIDPGNAGYREIDAGVRNLYSIEDLNSAVKEGDDEGFIFDLTNITRLNDGSVINPRNIFGTIYAGPYPFEENEVDYTYKRFRSESNIENGVGKIDIDYLMSGDHNSEGWVDRGSVMVRVKLSLEENGKDRDLGMYDFILNFKKNGTFVKEPSIIEGPFISNMNSSSGGEFVISFKTSEPCKARVLFNNSSASEDTTDVKEHYFYFKGTENANYNYHIEINGIRSKNYNFRVAPPEGETDVIFAYTGDSREGVGSGEREFMGVNYYILERLANIAYRKGADFFIFGGDLVNGYTSSIDDFNTQLFAWKSAMSGFWHTRPVYPAMGNHESLLRIYDDGSSYGIELDRWPYNTDSAEAIFAENFVNPNNGPTPEDSRRPPYSENVFSFTYGDVMIIAFNNNYWYSSNPSEFGGSPEGYILNDQLEWIKGELEKGENNENIRHIILFAQEPVIPNGGHIDDAMWWSGNNNITAYTANAGRLEREQKGIIDVRNEFVEAVTSCKKVAAVLGSDEHAYYRILISNDVPLGDPAKDDIDGDGIICEDNEPCSSLNIKYPTWFLTSGGGGAPYYSEEETPWNTYLKNTRPEDYYYTSQYNMILFKSNGATLSVEIYNPYGQLIDKIEDLASVKG